MLSQVQGTVGLMANLLYGSGLRLMECVRLRVKDLDFDYHQILVRDGKGDTDRVTMNDKRWTRTKWARLLPHRNCRVVSPLEKRGQKERTLVL